MYESWQNPDNKYTHSWVYKAVNGNWQMRAIVMIFTLFLLGIISLIIWAINPGVRGSWGWNSIDHISDPRLPWHDYSTAEITSLANSTKWLALGTEFGLTLFNKRGLVPREQVTVGAVLDVTRGFDDDGFFVLSGNQEITHVTPHLFKASQDVWLPRPANPVWPLNFLPDETDIVASEYNDQGWLLALRNGGIARYLFESRDGQLYRTRSWQVGDLSSVPLEQAFITTDGVWLGLESGGIRYAEKESLMENPDFSIDTPPIQKFEGDYNGQWASAIDQHNGLWLFGKNTGWSESFLGHGEQDCQLQELTDITVSRLNGSIAWLGTSYGLFAYDTFARRLHCVIPGTDVIDIAVPITPDDELPSQTILVGSGTGLFSVQMSPLAEPFTHVLDTDPVVSMSFNPSSNFLVYEVHDQTRPELRTLHYPLNSTEPFELIPNRGWQQLEDVPTVVGIESIGSEFLFATSAGAFLYEPDTHSYVDRSISLAMQGEQEQNVELYSFTKLHRGENGLLAVADGSPQYLHDGDESSTWISLDPSRTTHPIDIAQANERIFGLGESSQLYTYQYPLSFESEVYLTGTSSTLVERPFTGNRTLGDLLVEDNGNWSVSFLHDNNIVTYTSNNGHITQSPFPIPGILDQETFAAQPGIKQLRNVDGHIYFLNDDGMIIAENDAAIFGFGGLPFAPDQTTAVAPGQGKNTLLLGGPSGVVEYDWNSGSVYEIGNESFLNDPAEAIKTVLTTPEGIFASSTTNRLFHAWGEGWAEVGTYESWTTNDSGSDIWGVENNNILQLFPSRNNIPATWERASFSKGEGMHEFVSQATFAWQPSEKVVIFFTNSAEVGIYDSASDTFQTRYISDITRPHSFVADDDFVIFIDGNSIKLIDSDLHIRQIKTLSPSAENLSLYLDGQNLRIAFIENNIVSLIIWEDFQENNSYIRFQRGMNSTLQEFDPTHVVYAQHLETSVLLADKYGNLAEYDYIDRNWTLRRQAEPGQETKGWFSRPNDEIVLLLTTPQNTMVVVDVIDSKPTREHEIKLSFQTFLFVIKWVSTSCSQTSYPPLDRILCDSVDWYKEFLTRVGLPFTPIMEPRDGLLLEETSFRVIRQNGSTQYQVLDGNRWLSLTPGPGGFSEDIFDDVSLSASGQLWVLRNNQLLNFEPIANTAELAVGQHLMELSQHAISIQTLPTGHIRVSFSDGKRDELFQESSETGLVDVVSPIESHPLATLDFADHKLDWLWQLDGSIRGEWRGNSLPAVWDRVSGELAHQQIQDIALTNDGDLLIVTEVGLFVRSSHDFSTKAVYPDIRNARFIRTFGPERLIIQVGQEFVFEWRDKQLFELKAEEHSEVMSKVEAGPWLWQLQLLATGETAFSVIHKVDGHHRDWMASGTDKWRFTDDVVTWIARNEADFVWLETIGGNRPCNFVSQCTNNMQLTKTEAEQIENPAIRISYSNGEVSFFPTDGNNEAVFENGRFFFDNGDQIIGHEGGLYVFIPGRGIILRDPFDPLKIIEFWPLPTDVVETASYRIEETFNGIRIATQATETQVIREWELVLKDGVGEWQPMIELEEPGIVAEFGSVLWRHAIVNEEKIEPFFIFPEESFFVGQLMISIDQAQSVDSYSWSNSDAGYQRMLSWWHNDRFAWDQVNCAVVLDGKIVILATAIGPLAGQIFDNGTFPTMILDLVPGTNFCAAARDENGDLVGQLVGNTENPILFATNPQEILTAEEQNRESLLNLLRRPLLTIKYMKWDDGYIIDINQTWIPYLNQEYSQQGHINSELPRFSASNLFKGGQFIFDHVSSAVPVEFPNKPTAGSAWLTYTDLECQPHNNSTCIIAYNEIVRDQETGLYRFILRDVWVSDVKFYTIRSTDGIIWGCQKDDCHSTYDVKQGILTDHGLNWRELHEIDVSLQEKIASAFQLGHIVSIDAKTTDWSQRPLFVWESPTSVDNIVNVTPRGYPIFARLPNQSNGIFLSFDVFTSLALDNAENRLMVGTYGGLFTCSCHQDDGYALLALSQQKLIDPITFANKPASWVLVIKRLRYDSNGQLWVKYGQSGQTASLKHDSEWHLEGVGWADKFRLVGNVSVNIDESGIEMDGQHFGESLDAWFIGRKALDDIADFTFDSTTQTLWIVTSHNGLFKVILSDTQQ